MKEKALQRGFFLTEDGSAFHPKAESGDEMIKPKKKKEPKPKKVTPFQEVSQLERTLRQRAKILEEYGASEDMNGNIFLMRNGQMSQIGWDEATEFLKELQMNRPDLPEIPALSPVAVRLRYVLLKKQKQRGPLQAPPFRPLPDVDAFGNSLK